MNLTIAQIARLTEGEAADLMRAVRWPNGVTCTKCGCAKLYDIRQRKQWQCKDCKTRFSLLSGTIFSCSKLAKRDLLLLIALFAKNARGISANQMRKYFGHQYKTVFVTAHKLRECMWREQQKLKLSGVVEIDGAFFGGYLWRPNTARCAGQKRRYSWHGTRKVVVVARERGGRTVTIVVKKESEAVFALNRFIQPGSTVHADGGRAWNEMKKLHTLMRINHAVAFSADGACTNWAESFFARMRASTRGVYTRVAGNYLAAYAAEIAWREDNRKDALAWRTLLKLAMEPCGASDWKKYWQKSPLVDALEKPIDVPVTYEEIQSVRTGTFG